MVGGRFFAVVSHQTNAAKPTIRRNFRRTMQPAIVIRARGRLLAATESLRYNRENGH